MKFIAVLALATLAIAVPAPQDSRMPTGTFAAGSDFPRPTGTDFPKPSGSFTGRPPKPSGTGTGHGHGGRPGKGPHPSGAPPSGSHGPRPSGSAPPRPSGTGSHAHPSGTDAPPFPTESA